MEARLGLPDNSTLIRPNIVDTFSCENKAYGYYADIDNECQLFHICHPVELADGTSTTFKFSFICPEQTIFNQVSFFDYSKIKNLDNVPRILNSPFSLESKLDLEWKMFSKSSDQQLNVKLIVIEK